MRLSELYFELTKMIASTKPGEDPPIYVKDICADYNQYMNFESFCVDEEGDFIIEVS